MEGLLILLKGENTDGNKKKREREMEREREKKRERKKNLCFRVEILQTNSVEKEKESTLPH